MGQQTLIASKLLLACKHFLPGDWNLLGTLISRKSLCFQMLHRCSNTFQQDGDLTEAWKLRLRANGVLGNRVIPVRSGHPEGSSLWKKSVCMITKGLKQRKFAAPKSHFGMQTLFYAKTGSLWRRFTKAFPHSRSGGSFGKSEKQSRTCSFCSTSASGEETTH